MPIDDFLTQHACGGSGQEWNDALLGQAALFGDARAPKFLHILTIFTLTAVVARTWLTLVATNAASTLHVRAWDVLWTETLLDGAFGARHITHRVFARVVLVIIIITTRTAFNVVRGYCCC